MPNLKLPNGHGGAVNTSNRITIAFLNNDHTIMVAKMFQQIDSHMELGWRQYE
jgi:hypothetical protein